MQCMCRLADELVKLECERCQFARIGTVCRDVREYRGLVEDDEVHGGTGRAGADDQLVAASETARMGRRGDLDAAEATRRMTQGQEYGLCSDHLRAGQAHEASGAGLDELPVLDHDRLT